MPNPLYSTTVGTLNNNQGIAGYPKSIARSDNSAVFLAGIVGVPWQDIGTTASGSLVYVPVTDPAWTSSGSGTSPDNPPSGPKGGGIWEMIYGDDNALIAPADVHMVESVAPRPGLPGPTAAANADPFNGHEYNTAREDLEYACIYSLPTPHNCACVGSTNYASCKYQNPNDCCDASYPADGAGGPGADYDKPLCNGTSQVAAKGYPGLREIDVLHDYATSDAATTKGNSIVASICPRDLSSSSTSPGYGYNPAVAALINRLKEKLKGSCLPRPLTVNADGTLPCVVVEVVPQDKVTTGMSCHDFCTQAGRDVIGQPGSSTNPNDGSPGPLIQAAVIDQMKRSNICDYTGQPACSSMCMCELAQESGANLTICQNNNDGSENLIPPGYCYVDPANGAGTNTDIVAKCPAASQRILRFAGNNPTGGSAPVPLPGSFVFSACQGSAISNAGTTTGDAG